MENARTVDKLAGYLIHLGIFAAVAALCWYFRSVLAYVILAFVMSLIGQPLMRLLRRVKIKGKAAPDWLLAVFTLLLVLAGLLLLVTQVIPVITGIVRDASLFSNMRLPEGNLIGRINEWFIGVFPGLGAGFDALGYLLDYLKGVAADLSITGIIGSVASAVAGVVVGLFSVVFISFFFIKDDKLFSKIIAAFTPDRLENKVTAAIEDIEHLLSRYFIGLIVEMIGVALIDFIGLWAIAQISFGYALGIAFIGPFEHHPLHRPADRGTAGRGALRGAQVRRRHRAGRKHLGVRADRPAHHALRPACG